MAAGKSTVTRRLQAATRRPAVSLDEAVSGAAGCGVPEIFAREGEDGFRRRELAALEALDAERNLVVDTGGGVVQTPAAVALLRSRGVVIWLDPAWETIRERLRGEVEDERPLVRSLGWPGLEELYRERRRLYAAAADFRLYAAADADPEALARTAMLRSLLWSRRGGPERR